MLLVVNAFLSTINQQLPDLSYDVTFLDPEYELQPDHFLPDGGSLDHATKIINTNYVVARDQCLHGHLILIAGIFSPHLRGQKSYCAPKYHFM